MLAFCIPVLLLMLESVTSIAIIFSCIFIHECGHIITCRLLKVRIIRFDIEPFGLTIIPDPLAPYKCEMKIALAGSAAGIAASLLGFIVFYFFPSSVLFYFSSMSFILSAVNLLPVSSLDGGTALKAYAVLKNGKEKGERLALTVSAVATAVLLLGGVMLVFRYDGNYTLAAMFACSAVFIPFGCSKKKNSIKKRARL